MTSRRPEPVEGAVVFALPNRGLPWGWTTLTRVEPSSGLDWATLEVRYFSGYRDEYLLPGEPNCPPLTLKTWWRLLLRRARRR